MNVHTEGLPMWGLGSRPDDAPIPEFDQVPPRFRKACGVELRDAALQGHHQNHKAHIHAVRMALLAGAKLAGSVYLTGDDASIIADQMQIPGDRRFLGAVFKGWDRVKSTGRYINSRIARRNARPVLVWTLV